MDEKRTRMIVTHSISIAYDPARKIISNCLISIQRRHGQSRDWHPVYVSKEKGLSNLGQPAKW